MFPTSFNNTILSLLLHVVPTSVMTYQKTSSIKRDRLESKIISSNNNQIDKKQILLRYHQVTMNTLILLMLAAMTAVEQAAPISSNTTTHTTSAQKTIDALKEEVKNGVTSVYQDILTLESNNVRHSIYL